MAEKKILLARARKDILALIVEYMMEHKGIKQAPIDKPLRSKIMKEVAKSEFDATFIDRIGDKRRDLYELILLANYLDMNSLLHTRL